MIATREIATATRHWRGERMTLETASEKVLRVRDTHTAEPSSSSVASVHVLFCSIWSTKTARNDASDDGWRWVVTVENNRWSSLLPSSPPTVTLFRSRTFDSRTDGSTFSSFSRNGTSSSYLNSDWIGDRRSKRKFFRPPISKTFFELLEQLPLVHVQ